MARKTNKTAHVLNLISKAKEEHQSESAEEDIEINSIDSHPTGDLSFMNTEISNDKELAEKIRDRLSKTIKPEAPSDTEEISEEQIADENASPNLETPHNSTENFKAPFSSGPENQAKETPAENSPAPTQKDPGYSYVNVLEEVVKLRVDEFIEMFDVCRCPRCRADVVALALNGLPPKYIVVDSSHVSPLLNFFSNHYKGMVTAQLSRACSIVKDNPHH